MAVDVFGNRALTPLHALADIKANRSHRLLAELSDFVPIITTNLDCGIENAISNAIYRVVANQTPIGGTGLPPLLKLHGSADLTVDQLGVTINGIRHGYGNYIESTLRSLWMSCGALIVCGYSGLDTCDLWRFLRRARALPKANLSIYWIDHSAEFQTDDISSPTHFGFHLFRQSIPTSNLHVLRGPTYEFLHSIRSRLLDEYIGPSRRESPATSHEAPELVWSGISEQEKHDFMFALYDRLCLTDLLLDEALLLEATEANRARQVHAVFRAGLGGVVSVTMPTGELPDIGEFARVASLHRQSGYETQVALEERHLVIDHASIDFENLTVGRSKADQHQLALVAEWLLGVIHAELMISAVEIDSGAYRRLSENIRRLAPSLLRVVKSLLISTGARLFATPVGLKALAAILYLRDIKVLDESILTIDEKGDVESALSLYESLLAADQNDVFWSAFLINELDVAFEATRLNLESYLVVLLAGNIGERDAQGIASSYRGLLARMGQVAGFTRNHHMQRTAADYDMIFAQLSRVDKGSTRFRALLDHMTDLACDRDQDAQRVLRQLPDLKLRWAS